MLAFTRLGMQIEADARAFVKTETDAAVAAPLPSTDLLIQHILAGEVWLGLAWLRDRLICLLFPEPEKCSGLRSIHDLQLKGVF